MEEVKDKEILEKIKNTYINLLTCKNPYVIQGNFDYLKITKEITCVPIFGIEKFSEKLHDFLKKRKQENFYITQTHFVKERGGLVTDFFYVNNINIDNLKKIIDILNLTESVFYFFEISFYLAFNDFDYFLIIGKQQDIEELTGRTMLELLENTKEIDWYSDDRPEMYKTYKKFFEETGIIKE